MTTHTRKKVDARFSTSLARPRSRFSCSQVSGGGLNLALVNNALRSAALDAENAYKTFAEHFKSEVSYGYTGPREFNLDFTPSTMVATTSLVSAMYPSAACAPGGNDCAGWVATTMTVPSAEPITLADLFGGSWLEVVSAQTKLQVARQQYCQPDSTGDLGSVAQNQYNQGVAPMSQNYKYFALSHDGVAIGLQQGQIGIEACGTKAITLPWPSVQTQLTASGRQLEQAAEA